MTVDDTTSLHRYEVTALIGPCTEDEAVEVALTLDVKATYGCVSVSRFQEPDGEFLYLRRRLAEAEKALAAIVDFPIREGRSAGWHFAEVRQIARDALAILAEGAGEETNE